MPFKHLFIGALAATSLSISGASAATTVLWDFSVGTAGNIGLTTTQDSVPDSIPVEASGFFTFGGRTFAHDLFRKEAGGDESGLGLDGFTDNEIVPGSFIQLNLSSLTVPPLTNRELSFSANSVTGGDTWELFLSNTAGSFSGTPALMGTDEGIHFINTTGFKYLDVTAASGTVLLHTIDGVVPEPSTWVMMVLGFAGLGYAGFRSNRRKRALSA